MKIVSSFVTNSSSTSFVVVQKEKLNKKFFLEHFGIDSKNILYRTFSDWYDGIKSRIKQVPQNVDLIKYLDKEGVSVGEDDKKEILKRYILGETVYYGSLSTDADSGAGAEVYFATESVVIIDDDFYFTNKNMQP